MINLLAISFLVLLVYFSVFYLIALRQGIYNTVDIAYGTSFIVIAVFSVIMSDNNLTLRKLVITGLVALWGIRIAYFLTIRKYGKDEVTTEDKRFKIMRDNWGKSSTWKGFFFLYLPQVFTILLVSFPVSVVNFYSNSRELSPLEIIVLGFILIAIFGELLSDFQLYQFKRNPNNTGKIYTSGLWKYSQHPNYFFEMSTWWAFWFFTLISVPSSEMFWALISIIGPVIITLSLLKVSGIPLLNRRFESDPSYSEYQERTSTLIPWFPKK